MIVLLSFYMCVHVGWWFPVVIAALHSPHPSLFSELTTLSYPLSSNQIEALILPSIYKTKDETTIKSNYQLLVVWLCFINWYSSIYRNKGCNFSNVQLPTYIGLHLFPSTYNDSTLFLEQMKQAKSIIYSYDKKYDKTIWVIKVNRLNTRSDWRYTATERSINVSN